MNVYYYGIWCDKDTGPDNLMGLNAPMKYGTPFNSFCYLHKFR